MRQSAKRLSRCHLNYAMRYQTSKTCRLFLDQRNNPGLWHAGSQSSAWSRTMAAARCAASWNARLCSMQSAVKLPARKRCRMPSTSLRSPCRHSRAPCCAQRHRDSARWSDAGQAVRCQGAVAIVLVASLLMQPAALSDVGPARAGPQKPLTCTPVAASPALPHLASLFGGQAVDDNDPVDPFTLYGSV